MAWYNPTTWFKPKPKPTYTVYIPTSAEREKGYRYVDEKLVAPTGEVVGTYSTGGSAGGYSGGGGYVSPTPSAPSVGGTYYRPGEGGVSTAFPEAGDIPITTPTAKTLQPATKEVGWYQGIESQASKKLYGMTGFSEEQHRRQTQAVEESGQWLKGRVVASTETLKGWGVLSWFATGGEWVARFGVGAGTWISGGVGTIGKMTMDKPITTPLKYAAYGAMGAGIGFGISGALTGATAISPVVGTVAQVGVTGAGIGLGGYYAYGVGKQVYEAPTSFERGGIIGTEGLKIAAIGGGYASGQKGWQQTAGWWRTRGRVEIPAEQLIPAKILSGEKRFVVSPTGKISQKEYLRLFEKESQILPGIKEPIAYHQTPGVWWKGKGLEVTQPGTSEFPGLYGAYKVSPHFLKVGGEYKIFSLKDWAVPPSKAPGTVGIIPTRFTLTQTGKPGTAFIPATKPEVEAIFPMGTKAVKVSTDYFYRWKGVRVPIDVYKATPPSTTPPIAPVVDVSKAVSSYGAMPSYSLISPTSLAVSSVIPSYRLSLGLDTSYKPSGAPSYKPSYAPSYAPSTLSSYRPPRAPSYKPSYAPSYAPSSKLISYTPPKSLPWFPKPSISMVGGRMISAKQIFRYTPSYAGFTWGIKAPQIPKAPFGKFTGLEIRPIVPGGIKFKI